MINSQDSHSCSNLLILDYLARLQIALLILPFQHSILSTHHTTPPAASSLLLTEHQSLISGTVSVAAMATTWDST